MVSSKKFNRVLVSEWEIVRIDYFIAVCCCYFRLFPTKDSGPILRGNICEGEIIRSDWGIRGSGNTHTCEARQPPYASNLCPQLVIWGKFESFTSPPGRGPIHQVETPLKTFLHYLFSARWIRRWNALVWFTTKVFEISFDVP